MCEWVVCFRKTVFQHEPLETSMTGLAQAVSGLSKGIR